MCKLKSRRAAAAAAVVAGFAVKWKFANVYLFFFALSSCFSFSLSISHYYLPPLGSVLGLCKRSMNWERNSSGKLSRNVIFPLTQRAKRRLSFSSRYLSPFPGCLVSRLPACLFPVGPHKLHTARCRHCSTCSCRPLLIFLACLAPEIDAH